MGPGNHTPIGRLGRAHTERRLRIYSSVAECFPSTQEAPGSIPGARRRKSPLSALWWPVTWMYFNIVVALVSWDLCVALMVSGIS